MPLLSETKPRRIAIRRLSIAPGVSPTCVAVEPEIKNCALFWRVLVAVSEIAGAEMLVSIVPVELDEELEEEEELLDEELELFEDELLLPSEPSSG